MGRGVTESPRSSGDAGAFSFHPSKNLGAWGDAGAAVTHDPEVDARLRALRTFGSARKNEHPIEGVNSRLDAVQAVVLSAKLAHLQRWNEARRAAARRYDTLLAGIRGVRLPRTLAGNEHVFHLYVVRVPERDRVLRELDARGIGAAVHYPAALPRLGAFASRGHAPGEFPIAERAASEVLSLPLHPYLRAEIRSASPRRWLPSSRPGEGSLSRAALALATARASSSRPPGALLP